ncbi:hypothetical protein EON79_04850 [bacterium]|nr:MAG: hypothetical protein EON79_04850 [bacterium]
MASAAKQRSTGRLGRTLRALAIIVGIGVVLAVWNAYNLRKDVATATGPQSEAQKQFLVGAADRPDIAVFFKNLLPEQRLAMAQAIGRYDDPKLPIVVGKLLGDFDVEARKALTTSLIQLVKTQPEAVAQQLKEKGSFQQIGVFTALRTTGPSSLPLVAKQLSVGDARPNVIAYLVEQGAPSIPVLLPYLDDANNDVKLAAAEALGKLRAREATAKLVQLYNAAEPEPKAQYLAALSGIGDPTQEPLMARILGNEASPVAQRTSAALGLGRIANPGSVATLWRYVDEQETAVRESAIAGLVLAGDLSLEGKEGSAADRLAVAAGLRSAKADEVIRASFADPALVRDAARAATGRPALVATLAERLGRLNMDTEGDLADLLIESLTGTKEGEARLVVLKQNPEIAALADRRG